MKLSDFDYDLPRGLIAQHPLESRDHSRLMVINRKTGSAQHRFFYDIADFVDAGDTLVFNNSRVIPARLKGKISGSERNAEILLLKQLTPDTWETLVRPGRRLPAGSSVTLSGTENNRNIEITARVIERGEGGIRVVAFSDASMLDTLGEMPLPPYIKARLADSERYQTVYAEVKGSAAAPTAGLHFTPALLEKIKAKGANLTFITLHIGLDTFQPVRAEDPSHHQIHSEYGRIDEETAQLLNKTKQNSKRVIAVGTTSMRLVESASSAGQIKPLAGPIGLFILPGYGFKSVDAVITNFHLPKSTLLMMISAFAGREFILDCYKQAIREGYRFYSFGDAMLIL
jgi:S-adenosylmethionine:tRNA ribosyltransferase-isomerase